MWQEASACGRHTCPWAVLDVAFYGLCIRSSNFNSFEQESCVLPEFLSFIPLKGRQRPRGFSICCFTPWRPVTARAKQGCRLEPRAVPVCPGTGAIICSTYLGRKRAGTWTPNAYRAVSIPVWHFNNLARPVHPICLFLWLARVCKSTIIHADLFPLFGLLVSRGICNSCSVHA